MNLETEDKAALLGLAKEHRELLILRAFWEILSLTFTS